MGMLLQHTRGLQDILHARDGTGRGGSHGTQRDANRGEGTLVWQTAPISVGARADAPAPVWLIFLCRAILNLPNF